MHISASAEIFKDKNRQIQLYIYDTINTLYFVIVLYIVAVEEIMTS